MKHLKLVINNDNKKKDIFFNKKELQIWLHSFIKTRQARWLGPDNLKNKVLEITNDFPLQLGIIITIYEFHG